MHTVRKIITRPLHLLTSQEGVEDLHDSRFHGNDQRLGGESLSTWLS